MCFPKCLAILLSLFHLFKDKEREGEEDSEEQGSNERYFYKGAGDGGAEESIAVLQGSHASPARPSGCSLKKKENIAEDIRIVTSSLK
jgi:hypothetical protein